MSVGITIKDAVKRYGSNTIIKDLSVSIKGGELFTLLGPSGLSLIHISPLRGPPCPARSDANPVLSPRLK